MPDENISKTHVEFIRLSLGLLTEDEFAAVVGVTKHALAMWRWRGRGPNYTKLGKQVFYRPEDVRDWAAEQVVVPSPSPGAPQPEPSGDDE